LFGFEFVKVLVFVNWVLQDHYKVLELNCDASDDEIRSSFIRLALVPSLFHFIFPLICDSLWVWVLQWWLCWSCVAEMASGQI